LGAKENFAAFLTKTKAHSDFWDKHLFEGKLKKCDSALAGVTAKTLYENEQESLF
jgi:hypothetical protein